MNHFSISNFFCPSHPPAWVCVEPIAVLMVHRPGPAIAEFTRAVRRHLARWQIVSIQPEDLWHATRTSRIDQVSVVSVELAGHAGNGDWEDVLDSIPEDTPWLAVLHDACQQNITDALRAGAAGVIGRDAPLEEFVDALERVVAGMIHVPRATSVCADSANLKQLGAGTIDMLTPRQREICSLVAQGKSNKQICRMLNVSEGTIKNHLHGLFRRIGVSNRTEAGLWMSRHQGLVSQSQTVFSTQ